VLAYRGSAGTGGGGEQPNLVGSSGSDKCFSDPG